MLTTASPSQKAQLLSFFHSHSPAPIPDLNRPEFRRATFGEKTDTVCADTAEKGEAAEVSDSNKTQRSVQGEEACETSTPRECSANMQSSSSSSERALLPRPGVRVAAERIVVPEVLFRPQGRRRKVTKKRSSTQETKGKKEDARRLLVFVAIA